MSRLALNPIFFVLILIFMKAIQLFFRPTILIIQINVQVNEFAM